MKLYDGGALIIGILIVALSIEYASSRWLGDDNAIEEAAEEVIESQTGMDMDIDLSSDSKEG